MQRGVSTGMETEFGIQMPFNSMPVKDTAEYKWSTGVINKIYKKLSNRIMNGCITDLVDSCGIGCFTMAQGAVTEVT